MSVYLCRGREQGAERSDCMLPPLLLGGDCDQTTTYPAGVAAKCKGERGHSLSWAAAL